MEPIAATNRITAFQFSDQPCFTLQKLGPNNLLFLSWILIDLFPLGSLIPPPPPLSLPEVMVALTQQCIGYSPVALTPCASIPIFFFSFFLL